MTEAASKPVLTFRAKNRMLHLTREGAGFILLILGVGFGAINTGNNLLYLVLSMCCSFLVISGILSELTLKKVTVEGILPATVYAQDYFPFTIKATNHKKRFSSYSLRISLIANRESLFDAEEEPALYLFHLPAGKSQEKSIMIRARKRGSLQLVGFHLSTSFPFGFFIKFIKLSSNCESIVFPEIHPVHLPDPSNSSNEEQGIIRHDGEEIYALKEYREGDPLSAVHWKSSAKTGDLRIKEFASGGKQSFTIFLNLEDPQTGTPVENSLMEQRVSEAASLAYHLIHRGDEVSLKTPGHQIPFANAPQHLEEIMTFLAFIGWNGQKKTERRPGAK